MQIFCYIPPICLTEGEASIQVRIHLEQALALKLKPAHLPRGTPGKPVRLDDDMLALIDPLTQEYGLARGRVVGGLLYALHFSGGSPTTKETAVVTPITQHLRPGQARCLEEAAPLLHTGKVLASECGTGSGKSRLIAHAIAYVVALRNQGCPPPIPTPLESSPNSGLDDMPAFIREYAIQAQNVCQQRMDLIGQTSPRAVLISAPSVENVSHLAREWISVRQVLDPKRSITTAVVLGRGQFVSESQLATILAEAPHPEVQAWLDAGMPAGQIPATAFLKEIEPQLCGLMADLESIAAVTDLPFQDACLDEDSPPTEQDLYRTLRSKAFEVDVVWTTHAMLCMDNMRLGQKVAQPLLPAPLALFVDEAHLLESIQANMAAKSLSFMRLFTELRSPLWASIRKDSPARTALASARDVVDRLKSIPNETPLPVLRSGDAGLIQIWDSATPSMKRLQQELSGLIKDLDTKKKSFLNAQHGKSVRYVQKAIMALQQIGKDFRGHIQHTPRRGCISFSIGPSSVDRYIAARWATTPTAMLLSGTLHHIGAHGVNSTAVYREMSIPTSRRAATTPLHPSWVTETPVVKMPASAIFHRFVPPTGDDINELSMASWLNECAKAINLAASDAAGGMLVLMTGYERLEGLNLALREGFPALSSRLLVQTRQSRLSSNIPVFKAMARHGERPIWLATGSAWTGLDLADDLVSDANAQDDNVLTDLVLPNLPFGLHRSTTHVSRVSRLGFGVEALATQRLLRQGLGRGMRREGVNNRRYWILDGRLQHPAAANYTADLRRILIAYIHREPFNV